jgi:hypothetical protein
MKNLKLFSLMLLACGFIFFSCENTTDIKLSSASVELDETTVESPASKGQTAELNTFSATQVITLDNLQGLTDEANKYRSKIQSVRIDGKITVAVIAIGEEDKIVEEFVMTGNEGVGSFNVDKYKVGTPHVVGADAQTFVTNLLLRLLANKSVSITVSGKTDIESGKKLKVKITAANLVLETKIL